MDKRLRPVEARVGVGGWLSKTDIPLLRYSRVSYTTRGVQRRRKGEAGSAQLKTMDYAQNEGEGLSDP